MLGRIAARVPASVRISAVQKNGILRATRCISGDTTETWMMKRVEDEYRMSDLYDGTEHDADADGLTFDDDAWWNKVENWDANAYIWKLKVDRVMDGLNIGNDKAKRRAFRDSHDLSQGYYTLDFLHPSPPPAHTYEELPILKEIN